MKLNSEYVRSVLICIERLHGVFVNDDGDVEKGTLWIGELYAALPQIPKEDVFYTVYNLEQAGCIDITVQWIGGSVSTCAINHMTYEGHEFLESIRDESRWGFIKKGLGAVRNYSLSAISSIAEGATSAAINTYFAKS